MKILLLSSAIIIVAIYPINSWNLNRNKCRRDEKNEVAQELVRFEKIPEIGKNISHFAHMNSALYKYGHNKIRYHSTKNRHCIVDDFNKMDKVQKDIESDLYSNHQENELNKALNAARDKLSHIQPVYEAVKTYELFQNSTLPFVIEKCSQHDPHSTLGYFKELVRDRPKLFKRIAQGVRYDMTEFKQITSALINRLSICAVLTKVCDILRGKASDVRNYQQHVAAEKLALIRDELEMQVKILQTEFNIIQVENDIEKALEEADYWNYGLMQTSNAVRQKLSHKYYHHQWAVLAYKKDEDSSHASFELSGNSSFFFEYGEFAIVAHAAHADDRCSRFATIFSSGRNLKTLFHNEDLFRDVLIEENDLPKCAANLRELLVKKHKLHAEFFIGVIQYSPNYAVSFDPAATSHHIESLRNPNTLKLTKTVIIGWC